MEPYVARPNINKRRIITQLRCGCLPIEAELGRYRSPKTPWSDRKCLLCNEEEIGDEPHFLLKCDALKELRPKLLDAMSSIAPNFDMLNNDERTETILRAAATSTEVGNAIYEMYIKRCNLLR